MFINKDLSNSSVSKLELSVNAEFDEKKKAYDKALEEQKALEFSIYFLILRF